jgi:hypothetical protein
MNRFFRALFQKDPSESVMDAEYEPYQEELRLAGLDEASLLKMDPDDRVAALEQANLDPYDYIYLACFYSAETSRKVFPIIPHRRKTDSRYPSTVANFML